VYDKQYFSDTDAIVAMRSNFHVLHVRWWWCDDLSDLLNKDLTSTRRLVDASQSQSSPQGRGPEISLRDSLGSAGSRRALCCAEVTRRCREPGRPRSCCSRNHVIADTWILMMGPSQRVKKKSRRPASHAHLRYTARNFENAAVTRRSLISNARAPRVN